MAALDSKSIQAFAEELPKLLKSQKIKRAEAAAALQFSRQALYKKIDNPSQWKLGELMILTDLIRSKETAAMLGSNRSPVKRLY